MGEMKVYRGKKNHKDVGRVVSFNGDTGELNFLFYISLELVFWGGGGTPNTNDCNL